MASSSNPPPPLDPNTGAPVRPQEGDIIKSLKSRPIASEDAKNGTRQPTMVEGLQSIKLGDFSNLAQAPCVRQGLLYGFTAGGVAGGVRWAFRGSPMQAANWAVGFWLLASAASHQQCQYQRRSEKGDLRRHVEIITTKKKEEEKKLEEARQAYKKLEEEQGALRTKEKRWWKPW